MAAAAPRAARVGPLLARGGSRSDRPIAAWLRQIGLGGAAPDRRPRRAPSATANHYVQVFLTGLAAVALDLVIFLMMLFFLLRDGDDLREAASRHLALHPRSGVGDARPPRATRCKAVLQAMIIVPLVQGIVAFLGLLGLRRALAAALER